MKSPRALAVLSVAVSIVIFTLSPVVLAKNAPYNPVIDPDDFTSRIDNPFFPLKPGTIYTYEGMTDAGPELNTVEVTHSTRVIMGVPCVEVIDTVLVGGVLEELTLDWYAQDEDGNVWYFGEDSRQYSGGVQVGTEGSWVAGVGGALPGITMEAHPRVGDIYRQEYLRRVAEDMAEVLSLSGSVAVPYDLFDECVVTKDYSPLDRKSIENKWYARGVGCVRSKAKTPDGPEVSVLVTK